MELLTIWDLKRLAVKIVAIIQADVQTAFLNTAKNVPNTRRVKMMEIIKEDLHKQVVKAIKRCHWRKDYSGKCEVLFKLFKENQKEENKNGTA